MKQMIVIDLSVPFLQGSNDVSTAERKRLFFRRFLKTVFDEAELRHSEHEFNCCRKHPDTTTATTGRNATPGGGGEEDNECSIASTDLQSKLQAVLDRLVTDYRAIFAIEGACERLVLAFYRFIKRVTRWTKQISLTHPKWKRLSHPK